MTLHNGQRALERVRPKWRPISFWPWTLAAAAAVVIVAVGVTMWLYAIAGGAKPGTDRANARLDAVRTGLAAGAGAGAAVGLMLAFRRQHHQEIATDLTDRDASERRITELYTKAVEQLGSDKAPVRLGGLYALERLAQDNPAHRQTIVNVICAYLRMPFSPPAPAGKPELEAEATNVPAAETEANTAAPGDTWQQERQVRLTAQRILAEHLRAKDRRSTPPNPRFWPGISLDLTGATLIDFSFGEGVVADAWFGGATFTGTASFPETTFDYAWFTGATFSSHAWFGEATFYHAEFQAATFTGHADFSAATIGEGDARFNGASFGDEAIFHGAAFGGNAEFQAATFTGHADFSAAAFCEGDARFNGAIFGHDADFVGTTFSFPAGFRMATFSGSALFDGATFSGGEDSLSFEESRVLSPGAGHVWPRGWRLGPDGSGGYTVVRANDDASQPIPGDGSDGSQS